MSTVRTMEDLEPSFHDEDETVAPLTKQFRRTSRVMGNAAAAKIKEAIVYDYDIKNFVHEKPMRELQFTLPCFKDPIVLNPLTTFIGMVPLWAGTVWCMVQPDEALDILKDIRGNIALSFSWFIIITKPISLFFMLWITFKYGDIKFGGQDATPEFGNLDYFAMIFTTGVGVGMFFYGCSEPLWHQSSHWFAEAGYRSQDEIDQMAMVITVYHWGFHGFVTYLVVAIATSLASYRFRLPLIFRSSFYPILGEYTWGWMGDVIDGLSIVVCIAGVCTSLGLGAIQLTTGVQRIGWLDVDLTESETTNAQIVIIWLVTIMTTVSVLMGLSVGIRYLSLIAFTCGIILSLAILMMEQTSYLLNLMIQTTGQYLQHSLFELSFHTDTFGQLRPGEGRAIDGNAAAAWWFDSWTIFYWNWWVSWSVFVGLFITRVSYGRTLREMTLYSLAAPVFFLIGWFCIWGGASLRQARQALELEVLGLTYFNNTEYYQSSENSFCYDVPQDDVVVGKETVFVNYAKGVTPVCKFESTDSAAFNLLYSFSFPDEWDTGYGPYLSGVFLIALATYFATSSDSGSLVVDFLAANGRHNTHWLQRVFWALTEASVATALLSAGGSNALSALQAASVICGLPYTVVLTFLLQSIYEMCEQATDESKVHFELPRRQFIMPAYGGVFNVFEYLASLGRVHTARVVLGLDLPSSFQATEFFTSLVLPFLPLQKILFTMYPKDNNRLTNALFLAIYTACFFCWAIAFPLSLAKYSSMAYWGWAAYTLSACLLAKIKRNVRKRRRLHGNVIGDLMSSFLVYPQVLTQIRIELLEYGAKQIKEDEKKGKSKSRSNRRKTNSASDSSRFLTDSSHHSTTSRPRKSSRHLRETDSNTSSPTRTRSNRHVRDTDSIGSTSARGHPTARRRDAGSAISNESDFSRPEQNPSTEKSAGLEDRGMDDDSSSKRQGQPTIDVSNPFNSSSVVRRDPDQVPQRPVTPSRSVIPSRMRASDVRSNFRRNQKERKGKR